MAGMAHLEERAPAPAEEPDNEYGIRYPTPKPRPSPAMMEIGEGGGQGVLTSAQNRSALAHQVAGTSAAENVLTSHESCPILETQWRNSYVARSGRRWR